MSMSNKDTIEMLMDHVGNQRNVIQHNSEIFDIYEGNLLPYVYEALRSQLGAQSFDIAKKRIAPINMLTKLIDKLSKIYQQQPIRHVENGSDSDKELLSYYEKSMNINSVMNTSNEFYNLFKNTLLMPYVFKGVPSLRAIPSDKFTVFSNSMVSPETPTHVVTYQSIREEGVNKAIYYVYTDDNFIVVDETGKIRLDIMSSMDNVEGINTIGRIPFTYINRSKNLLIPKVDTDLKAMILLLPVMLSDLNFGAMMQAFSIIYGIDVDDEGLKMAPNAFWAFKSDETTDKAPQIGVLKPQIDIKETLDLIQSQITLWLDTKGVKAGSVGKLTSENYASGISKMIDAMDTSEERQAQVSVFTDAEVDLWDLNTNFMHPYWKSAGMIDQSLDFSKGMSVVTNFAPQLPLLNRGQIVEDLGKEVTAGFISKRRAIKKLNPRMSEIEIDSLLKEIFDEELSENVELSTLGQTGE